jgi:hypothetical protein
VHRPRAAALSALNCLFVHHLAARPESLGVIAWLLHCCCSLAGCAKGMAGARPHLIVSMSAQAHKGCMVEILKNYVPVLMSYHLTTFASVMQDLWWWEGSRVSRQPVLVLLLMLL